MIGSLDEHFAHIFDHSIVSITANIPVSVISYHLLHGEKVQICWHAGSWRWYQAILGEEYWRDFSYFEYLSSELKKKYAESEIIG